MDVLASLMGGILVALEPINLALATIGVIVGLLHVRVLGTAR